MGCLVWLEQARNPACMHVCMHCQERNALERNVNSFCFSSIANKKYIVLSANDSDGFEVFARTTEKHFARVVLYDIYGVEYDYSTRMRNRGGD